MNRSISKSLHAAVLRIIVGGFLPVLSSCSSNASDSRPTTDQVATPSSLPPGIREVPWKVDDGSMVSTSTTPPAGFTPPPYAYVYTADQAIETTMAILKRPQHSYASARRTTFDQVVALFSRVIPTALAFPTPTMPGVSDDFSSVVWAVVIQLPEPYTASEAAAALALPASVPTVIADAGRPDLEIYGNIVFVALDELGNAVWIRLLDPHMAGHPPVEVQPMHAFAVLGEVGPSITPTP